MGRLFIATWLLIACVVPAVFALEAVTGIVFNDRNGNGILDSGEPGVRGVAVSNGQDVVATDAHGRYTLPVFDPMTVFVVKPSGWSVQTDPETRVSCAYYTHSTAGSAHLQFGGVPPTGPPPKSLDFPLRKQREPRAFKVLIFGDSQARDQKEIDFLAHDIVEELIGTDAVLGVTLGDISFDTLTNLEPAAHCTGQIGIPWHFAPGNHDTDYDATDMGQTYDTFRRLFGPPYYAFNYGPVHFIVLNNIWHQLGTRDYHAELGEQQLRFVENDLRLVPLDRLVVVMMHIPVMELKDKKQLFTLLQDRPHTFSMSAHTHTQEHHFLGASDGWFGPKPHHHLVQGTTAGSWWRGPFDLVGIPDSTMSDGVPNGYSIVSFDGSDYKVAYKVARRPADYQMNISAPDSVAAAEAATQDVVVNVFAGSERSTVEMSIDKGAWTPMEQYQGVDPDYAQFRKRQQAYYAKLMPSKPEEMTDRDYFKQLERENIDIIGRSLPGPAQTPHLWKAKLPAGLTPGVHLISVRTTDMFGQHYAAKRIFRVE